MKKLRYLATFGAGYVLGARAGRERYEQIASGARRFARDPRVQSAASVAQDTVTTQAAAAAEVAKDKITSVASSAADKIRHEASVQPAP